MTKNEIIAIAKKMNVRTSGCNKVCLIRDIQRATGKLVCYGIGIGEDCGRVHCVWRADCLKQKRRP